jgi:hypothetical protein
MSVVRSEYDTRYYQNGVLHRDDGPAVITNNGISYWYKNDVLHRTDGPAVMYRCYGGEYPTITDYWFYNGRLHRENGPALSWDMEGKYPGWKWYRHGVLHRTDGPAVRTLNYVEGWYEEHWYINGVWQRGVSYR